MKCKPYSEITVEIRTQLKTVKITSNIFAVYLKPPQWNSVLISYLILQDGNWLLPQWLFHKLLKIFHHVGFQSPMKTPRRGCRPLQDTDVPDLFFYLFLDPYLMSGNLKGHLKKRRSKNELEEEKLECINHNCSHKFRQFWIKFGVWILIYNTSNVIDRSRPALTRI